MGMRASLSVIPRKLSEPTIVMDRPIAIFSCTGTDTPFLVGENLVFEYSNRHVADDHVETHLEASRIDKLQVLVAPLLRYAVDLKLFVKDAPEMAEIVCSRKSFIDQPHSSTRVSTSRDVKNVVVIVKPDVDKPGIYLGATKLECEILNGPEGMTEFDLYADVSISSVNNAEDALPTHFVTEYGFFAMRPITILDRNLLTVVYKKNRQLSFSSALPNVTLCLDESVFQVGHSLLAALRVLQVAVGGGGKDGLCS